MLVTAVLVCLFIISMCWFWQIREQADALSGGTMQNIKEIEFLQYDGATDWYEQEAGIILEIADLAAGEDDKKAKESGQNKSNGGENVQDTPSELQKFLSEQSSTKEITVALIDTGIDIDRISCPERIVHLPDTVPDYWKAYEGNSLCDNNGHGTIMAEIIAKNSNEKVKILPIAVADEQGKATVLKVCCAIRLATDCGADIINLSMNTLHSQQSDMLKEEIERAAACKVTVIVSAGNKGMDVCNIAPADTEAAVVVSAADEYGIFAGYSNYGETVDYCAPGSYGGYEGTSYATAYVSGVFADAESKELEYTKLHPYLYERGEPGRDKYYGSGLISLQVPKSKSLLESFFGENTWAEEESGRLTEIDAAIMTNEQINEWINRTDLADVGLYLSGLEEEDRSELLARDTVLARKICFYEGEAPGEDQRGNDDILLNRKTEMLFYEKCIELYEEESGQLMTSVKYLHKTGHFNLAIVDETGTGKSTVYEIHARVCLASNKLNGTTPENGQTVNRPVSELGAEDNRLTVWSTVSSGNRDTLNLSWYMQNGAYARFLEDDVGGLGRIFVPNIMISCPAYTLMYTKDALHAHGGNNCTGRCNFFWYSASNDYASSYSEKKENFRLRKYGMKTEESMQIITPQINSSHMNLSDTSRNQSAAETICTMYIYLNNPMTTLKVDPDGEKWCGKAENATVQVVNTHRYDLGKPTATNYGAVFYGGGDALDPVADQTIVTNKKFSHWRLDCFANGSGKMREGNSYMDGNVFVAGTAEYDKNARKQATTGQKATATAVFEGNHVITFPAAPYREGYTFEGWYTGKNVGSGTVACSKENAGKATVILDSDREYHARWSKNAYTVAFYDGEELLATKSYEYRTNIDLSTSEQVQDGIGTYYEQRIGGQEVIRMSKGVYHFVGWALEEGSPVVSGVTVPSHHNTKLYAVWSMPTSGMKQVVLNIKSGNTVKKSVIETSGVPQINATLGLRAYIYEERIFIPVVSDGVEVTKDGSSYAEDNAGNKTVLAADAAGAQLPVRHMVLYQFFLYDAATGEWNYVENSDRTDEIDLVLGETYIYTFEAKMCISAPEGYTYHHAEYNGEAVTLPYSIQITGNEQSEKRVETISIYFYPRQCTITYMACGGQIIEEGEAASFWVAEDKSYAQVLVLYGAPAGTPPGVQMGECYSCNGFFNQEHGGRQLQSNEIVRKDLTVYAQWQAKSGTVRYDAGTNLGTVDGGDYLDTDVTFDTAIPYQNYRAYRQGYEFLGWAEKSQELLEGKAIEVYPDTGEPVVLKEHSVTLYAQFQRELHVRFYQWTGVEYALRQDGATPVIYNREIATEVVSPYIAAYDGWSPIGWGMQETAPEMFTLGEGCVFEVDDDREYYALYSKPVTLYYDLQIVSNSVEEDETFFEGTDTKTAYHSTSGCADTPAEFVIREGPSREYYSFICWQGEDGNRYEPGDSYASVESLRLYAVWEADTAAIVYDASSNGGSIQNQAYISVNTAYGQQIDVDEDTFAACREGYEFIGWSTKKDARTKIAEPIYVDEKIMQDGVLTLYAIYKKTVTAEFYQQGEDRPVRIVGILFNNDVKVMIQAPRVSSYGGWEELGWTEERRANTTAELCSGMNYELSGDVSFYAVFRKRVFLTYDTQLFGVEIPIGYGYTYHNSFTKDNRSDLPADFVAARMQQQPGRSFLYWQDTGGQRFCPDDVIRIYKDEKLLAKWDEYPQITALDRYFTLEQATDEMERYINKEVLLDTKYVTAMDREDDNHSLAIELLDFNPADFKDLHGNARILIRFLVTDSYGNCAQAAATIFVVDTSEQREPLTKTIRFISPDYYRNKLGDVAEEQGGLHEGSLWRNSEEYASVLKAAMENFVADEKQARFSFHFSMTEVKERQRQLYTKKNPD